MRRSSNSGLVVGLALLAASAGPRPTEAATEVRGYACSVQLLGAPGLLGNFGAIRIRLTAERNCNGADVANVYACTLGGQLARQCNKTRYFDNTGPFLFLYDEAQLMALYESFAVAMAEQSPVSAYLDGDALPGATAQLRTVNFLVAGFDIGN